MDKKCCRCGKGEYSADCVYDGENGWFCNDCVEDLRNQFYNIFGETISQSTHGTVIDMAAVYRILQMVKDNPDMYRYEISYTDIESRMKM